MEHDSFSSYGGDGREKNGFLSFLAEKLSTKKDTYHIWRNYCMVANENFILLASFDDSVREGFTQTLPSARIGYDVNHS